MSLRIARRASLPVSGTVACALLESSDGGRSFSAAERVAKRTGKPAPGGLAPVAVVRSPVAVQTVRIPALHGSPDISTYITDPEGNMPGTAGAGFGVSVMAPRAKERTLHHVPFHSCIRREGVRAPRDPATTRAQRLTNRSMGR